MKKVIGTLLLFAFLSTAALAAEILHSQQPWLGDDTDRYSVANRSQFDVKIFDDYYEDFAILDNFQLSANASITSLRWWGGCTNISETEDFSFHIAIHSNVSDLPGDLIASWDFDRSECNESYYADALNAVYDFDTIYQYTVALPQEVLLYRDTQYWITICADMDTDVWDETWMWSNDIPACWDTGEFDNGDAITTRNYDPDTGVYSSYGYCEVMKYPCGTVGTADMAFELTGESVPEPATLAMIAAGLAAVAGAIRARR